MTKQELQEELAGVKNLYVAGAGMSQGVWNRFNVHYIKNGELYKIYIDEPDEGIACWRERKLNKAGEYKGGYFYSNTIGEDRTFKIVYDLGLWLFQNGYYFKDRFLSYCW